MEESDDEGENVSFEPGESGADVRLEEVESILESRGLDCVSFKRVVREIKAMKTFYTSEFNHKRRSGKMTVTTWLKVVERLVTFLSFGASKLEVTPSIALVKKSRSESLSLATCVRTGECKIPLPPVIFNLW